MLNRVRPVSLSCLVRFRKEVLMCFIVEVCSVVAIEIGIVSRTKLLMKNKYFEKAHDYNNLMIRELYLDGRCLCW